MDFVNYYDKLKTAYLNEHNCPELLPYETELITAIEAEIEETEDNIESKQQSGKESEYFESRILLMGLERSRFLLSSYLHTRLAKIEEFVIFLLANEQNKLRLSPAELNFATQYDEMTRKYVKDAAIGQFPISHQSLDEPEMVDHPNLDSHVICRIDDSVGDVEISPGGKIVHLEKGFVVSMRYRPIRGLVLSKKISFC